MNISVIVPVFNGNNSLHDLASRLPPVLHALCEKYELILVNDGSEDRSWETITRLTAEHDWVHGIDLMRNYGQHNALLCGIRAARYEIVVTADDDLQNPPEEIPKLLAKLEEGFDVVYGTPERERHGFLRDQASRITKIALRSATGSAPARHASALRAFRTRIRGAFDGY